MFVDKNGEELHIGDYIAPDEGLELLITEEKYMEDFGGDCLIATQVIHPDVYSILPQDNLSLRWSKISSPQSVMATSIKSVEELENNGTAFEAINEAPPIEDNKVQEEWKEKGKIYVG